MEVDGKVMAGPDAAGLEPDCFSRRSGDVSCGKADPEDVRAFERALAGGEKPPLQEGGRASREASRLPPEGSELPRPDASAPGRAERPLAAADLGAEAPEGKPARDPAPNIQKSAHAPDPEAGLKLDQEPDQRLDQKSAPKSGAPEEKPRARLAQEPGRSEAKDLNQEAFLAAMFGRGADPVNAAPQLVAAANASEAGAPKGAALAEGDLSRLVERILVGSPEKGGSEVRLVLNDRVLPGTEIRVGRDVSGALQVTIETRDAAAFQTLVGARNDLERALQASEKSPVSLDMRREGGDGGEGDMRRRSRGLGEQGDPR